MMYSSIARWIKTPTIERVASIHAGSLEEIAAFVLNHGDTALRLIVQRPLADTVAMRALIDGGTRPQITITRGLTKDLAALDSFDRDQTVLLQTRIVFDALHDARQRIAQTLRMLGGYDVEASAWASVVEQQVAKRLQTAASRRTGLLLLADCVSSASAARLWSDAPLFLIVQPGSTNNTQGLETDYITTDPIPQITPTLELVTAHGRFLATTDMSALVSMHAPIGSPDFDDVFIVWRSNLAIIASQPGTDGSAAQGIQRLAELQRHFARQKRP